MRPLEIACPRCAQQPNEICIDQYRIPLSYYHAERISDALALGAPDERISDDDIIRAIDRSGLI